MVIVGAIGLILGAACAWYCKAFAVVVVSLLALICIPGVEIEAGHKLHFAIDAGILTVFALQAGYLLGSIFGAIVQPRAASQRTAAIDRASR